MTHPTETSSTPTDGDLDALAITLVQRASLLTRSVFAHIDVGLPRTEAGVLSRLETGPQRISTLARAESLAQPTMTLVIKRLESLELVERRPDPEDGRATLISLTAAGAEMLAAVRDAYRTFLSERLSRLPAHDLSALSESMGALADLIELVRDPTI